MVVGLSMASRELAVWHVHESTNDSAIVAARPTDLRSGTLVPSHSERENPMGSIDDPRGRTNANLQDAIGKRAEQSQVQVEGETRDAVEPAGGTGGESGNGQM